MALLEQVRAGEPAAEHVVDRDRAAVVPARAAVDQHDRGAALDELLQPRVAAVVDRGDEHAADPLLLQQVEVAALPAGVLAAVADDDHDAALPRRRPRRRGRRR